MLQKAMAKMTVATSAAGIRKLAQDAIDALEEAKQHSMDQDTIGPAMNFFSETGSSGDGLRECIESFFDQQQEAVTNWQDECLKGAV